MIKNVGIFIFDDAEVLDFAGPFEVFSVTSELNRYEPFKVFTVGERAAPILAVNGLKIIPDYSFDDHPPIDILIVSGGSGTRRLLDSKAVLQWLLKIYQTSWLTLSICSGSRLIGKLKLLDNKPFCTHHEVYDHMREIAPLALPQPDKRFIKSDKRLYTSGGISAGIDLSLYIVGKILGKEMSERTAAYMEYNVMQPAGI